MGWDGGPEIASNQAGFWKSKEVPVSQLWRMGRIVSGFFLLVLGVIGLFLPVLQGIAMIVAGLLILAPEFPWAQRLLNWLRQKFSSVRRVVANATGKTGQ